MKSKAVAPKPEGRRRTRKLVRENEFAHAMRRVHAPFACACCLTSWRGDRSGRTWNGASRQTFRAILQMRYVVMSLVTYSSQRSLTASLSVRSWSKAGLSNQWPGRTDRRMNANVYANCRSDHTPSVSGHW